MKKIVSFLLVVVLAFTLAACKKEKRTEVTFASWGVGTEEENNLLRRRIKAFNDSQKEIKVTIMEHSGDWNEWLATQASAGNFPDIVMLNSVPDAVINEWITDISDVIDDEWKDIPQALRDSVTYGEKIYAVPAAYHYIGLYANFDLIEKAGFNAEPFEKYNFTIQQFLDAVKGMKSVNTTEGDGYIGINNAQDILNWLPSIYDKSGKIEHFVWNGEGFDYNGEAIKEAIKVTADLHQNKYTYDAYSNEKGGTEENPEPSERENIFGTNDWAGAAFHLGKVGFMSDGSWASSATESNVDGLFDYDFIGFPENRVIGVSDYYGISKTAKDKKAAYEVAKYLTFGKEGIEKAFELIEEAKKEDKVFTMAGLPINETESIVDKWFEVIPQKGFKNVFNLAAEGKVRVLMEGNKFVPGFPEARWHYNTGIPKEGIVPGAEPGQTMTIGDLVHHSALGNTTYTDHMTKPLADILNAKFQEAADKLASID